jgi:hypothetical protein
MKNVKISKMRTILFMSFFFGYLGVSFSQNIGIEEKETVNSLILTKAWSKNTPTGGVLLPTDPQYEDGSTCCYFDENDNLRKFVQRIDYSDSSLETIAYYSEEGELMYISFSDYQPEGLSYQGVAYKTARDEWSDTIEFRYKVQYSMLPDLFENYSIQGISNQYPAISRECNVLALYTNMENLAAYLHIETLQPPAKCKKVQFVKPSKNQITYINNDNVNLREGAKTSSKVILTMRSGVQVKILEVLQEETMRNVGTYNWYKIEVHQTTGYVFGAYLEPVDKEVKQ